VNVAAGAEVAALAGDDDGLDVVDVIERAERVAKLGIAAEGQRVFALRPVEADDPDLAVLLPPFGGFSPPGSRSDLSSSNSSTTTVGAAVAACAMCKQAIMMSALAAILARVGRLFTCGPGRSLLVKARNPTAASACAQRSCALAVVSVVSGRHAGHDVQ